MQVNPPPIFCISLARDVSRRANMTARLNELGAHYEIVDAVDGQELDLSELGDRLRQDKMRRQKGREMSPAEVGCYLSHYKVWQRIAADNIPAAIIAEDDAVFSADFPRIAAAAAAMPHKWDALHLATRDKMKPQSTLCKLGDSYAVCRPQGRMISMCGYALSQTGAKKILRECYEINDAVDWRFWAYWNNGAKMYAVFPRIIDNDDSRSNIALNKRERKAKRTFAEWRSSRMWKLSEFVKCRLYHFRHPLSRQPEKM